MTLLCKLSVWLLRERRLPSASAEHTLCARATVVNSRVPSTLSLALWFRPSFTGSVKHPIYFLRFVLFLFFQPGNYLGSVLNVKIIGSLSYHPVSLKSVFKPSVMSKTLVEPVCCSAWALSVLPLLQHSAWWWTLGRARPQGTGLLSVATWWVFPLFPGHLKGFDCLQAPDFPFSQ